MKRIISSILFIILAHNSWANSEQDNPNSQLESAIKNLQLVLISSPAYPNGITGKGEIILNKFTDVIVDSKTCTITYKYKAFTSKDTYGSGSASSPLNILKKNITIKKNFDSFSGAPFYSIDSIFSAKDLNSALQISKALSKVVALCNPS